MTHSHRVQHRHHAVKRSSLSDASTVSPHFENLRRSSMIEYVVALAKRSPPSSGSGSGGSSGSSPPTSSTSVPNSSSSCTPNDNSAKCQLPTSSNSATLPIVLGVVIPLVIALVIFLVLHRRHVKKLRSEDANDKHASLDFGMGTQSAATRAGKGGKAKGRKEMALNNLSGLSDVDTRRGRGLSMDMSIGSPYLLPPQLQSSRESLHSLSRTIHSGDDRYRTAMTFTPGDGNSIRSFPTTRSARRGLDDASAHTRNSGGAHEHMNQELLRNASGMSRSSPPNDPNMPTVQAPEYSRQIARKDLPTTSRSDALAPPSTGEAVPRDSYIDGDGGGLRRSNNYLGSFINARDSSMDTTAANRIETSLYHQATTVPPSPPRQNQIRSPHPPTLIADAPILVQRQHSMEADTIRMPSEPNFLGDEQAYLGEHQIAVPQHNYPTSCDKPLPVPPPFPSSEGPRPIIEDYEPQGLGDSLMPNSHHDDRRLSVSMRPLPPDDPTDDPEQRAIRIRSFYKEYFDESRQGPYAQAPQEVQPPQIGGYYEDFDQDYYGQEYHGYDASYLDPANGNFVMPGAPYAEPVTRRAMTPPPRAPPRFQGQGPPRGRTSSFSSGLVPPGPRTHSMTYSTASGPTFGSDVHGRGRPAHRKPMPPPSPLRMLPTPHLLQEDSFAMPIDFAPPTSYKDRQAGRPESLRGGIMPYQPAVPAHLPLASSFEDLSTMPSPYAMRNSGTFTGLDFAAPPRFKFNGEGTASDAGSIRSNRSAMSQQQLHTIRSGAYRVSRIPKEVVGTKDELADSLRPTWDMKR